MNDKIKQTLKERFAAELPENYGRRIIFWKDPEGSFASEIDELDLDGVKLLKLTGTNNFAAKRLLSETDTESDYLVYDPIPDGDPRDNWLRDIELYSEEFSADPIAIRMQELGIPSSQTMRRALRAYDKFFESKERAAKFKVFKSDYSGSTGDRQLDIDVLAVLAGADKNTAAGVIRAVLKGGLDIDENDAVANIRKFGDEEKLWTLIKTNTGFVYTKPSASFADAGPLFAFNAEAKEPALLPLAARVLLTALTFTMDKSYLSGFKDRFIDETHRQFCFDLVNEWTHTAFNTELYYIAREVEGRYHLPECFDKLETSALLDSDFFPCVDECILRKYMAQISDGSINADEAEAAVEKRRTMKWYNDFNLYYDGVLHAARMCRFKQEHKDGFHIAEHTKLWKAYTDSYCEMDRNYRLFHASFGNRKEMGTDLDDLFKNLADKVEELYKNWFLWELDNQWIKLVSDELAESSRLPGIPQQSDFYNTYVAPIEAAGGKTFVVISDALRYETAVELKECLVRETNGTAELSAVQSIFPSITKFGMAALLPHKELSLTADIKVLCDGEPTEGTEAREKVLNSRHPGNAAIQYKDLLGMKKNERRERVKDANVVYIYHNAIDAVGDKPNTEDQVFDACGQAVSELTNLVRIIANDMNGTNIFITADHGFIYTYRELNESDKADKDLITGKIIESGRRYVIANAGSTTDHLLKIPMTHVHSDLAGFTPKNYLRIKKQGGGNRYVHGGISLQECVVPVITYKNVRKSYKNYEEVKKAELQLIDSTRNKVFTNTFSLEFYQKEPVGGKTTEAKYEIYMADASGHDVSDRKTIIADKTDSDVTNRRFKITLNLKSMEFKKTESYYLTVEDKDKKNIVNRVEFTINVAFANDFGL